MNQSLRSLVRVGGFLAFCASGCALRTLADASFSQPDTTTAADSVVTFNEIMYHPPGNNPAFAWVELYNQMSVDADLSNWYIEGGVKFLFPSNTILPANGYIVVASDPAALRSATGATNVLGPFSKHLSNAGQTLRLRNLNQRIMDELTFGSDPPWPVAADGSGASLAKRDKYSASSPGANWCVSAHIGGTPGGPNFPELDSAGPPIAQLLNPASPSRWSVPANDALGQSWTLSAFDDTAWALGTASVGFDATTPATGAPPAARAWSFDGNVTDVSGHGFDGQNLGATFSTNVSPASGSGLSLQFDGLTSQVQVPDPVNPPGYTLALWVSVDVVRPCSLIVRTDNRGPDTDYSHQLRINASGQFEHYLWDGSERTVAATNIIKPGVWYHVAGTATNGGPMRIYVNGLSSGGAVVIGNLWSGGNQWRFGTDSGMTPNFFKGRLSQGGLWQAVLGAQDLARLAAGTAPILLDGLHSLIGTDVQSALFETNSSLFLRLPFFVPLGAAYARLALNVQYADGFVAWLNGAEVCRRNAPSTLSWDSTAATNRAAAAVVRAEALDLSAFASALLPGQNVLALQALDSAASDSKFLLTVQLLGTEAPSLSGQASLSFNEVSAATDPSFFVELLNHGTNPVSLAGCRVVSSTGAGLALASQTLSPGGFLTLRANDLGFDVNSGDELFLIGSSQNVVDGVKVGARLQGRLPSSPAGPWYFPSAPTPGATNQIPLHDEIVINEIMYDHAPDYATNTTPALMSNNDEQWLELYNRSAVAVDLSGWQLADAVAFSFPSNTLLAPDSYLVVANGAAALKAQYPDITVLGDFAGKLSHRGAHILLLDAQGNPANQVSYYPAAPWPAYTDGGGSSLELCDPRADNSVPESWAASRESANATWQHYSYIATAINPVYAPALYNFNEFRLGLIDTGEALLDNISVLELPTNSPPRQLLQNTNFLTGTTHWRLVGDHQRSVVEPNPDAPSTPVLHLIATAAERYLENHLETTLKAGGAYVPVVAGRAYQISFDAKWVAGSPQLHTELYYNKVAATTILQRPAHFGTPGRRNSTWLANAGPTYRGLLHSPAVPTPTDPINVSVQAADPDGVASLALHYAVNGGSWRTLPMPAIPSASTTYTAAIPRQPAASIIQFYVQGADLLGATSTYPSGGTNSRALIEVDSPQTATGLQTLRAIMTPADSAHMNTFINLMSDDPLGCTVIHNEREIFYNSHIRLHGSMFSRPDPSSTGVRLEFPGDHLFRGSRATVIVRRSDLVETIGRHILNQAGGLPANYCDVVYVIYHLSGNVGAATLDLAPYDSTYVDSQWVGNNDGTLFKLEGIRVYETTDNGTPEGYKLPQPVDFVWTYDITNLGNDPEQYRWSILMQSKRTRDDFSRAVAMGKAFSLTGTPLQQAAAAAIDVDEWARYFALQNLVGVWDIYGEDNPHNVAFYARPNDGRMVVLQNDWGGAFQESTSASIYGINNIYRILELPGCRRLYQGHLLDLINTTYNSAYLARWAQHFSQVTGTDFTSVPSYADARGASVRKQLAAAIPFSITSNGGTNFTVHASTVTLQGQGWINVYAIGLAGSGTPLPLVWLDDQRWRVTVPLAPGPNNLQLLAYNYRGAQVGQATITVTCFVPPAFAAVTQDGLQVHLQFQAVAQQSYTLYWRQNLTSGQWQVLATFPAAATTSLQEATDLLSAGGSQRFYRLAAY